MMPAEGLAASFLGNDPSAPLAGLAALRRYCDPAEPMAKLSERDGIGRNEKRGRKKI